MFLYKQLGWFFLAHRWTYALALAMLTGVALLNMAVPYLIGRAIDSLNLGDQATVPGEELHVYLLGLLGLALGVYALRFAWRQILFGTSYRLGGLLRRRFYQRLSRQGQAFYGRNSTGDLMARATNDIDAIEVAAGEGVLSGFDGLLTLVFVLAMMLVVIDWRLTLIALLPFPIMGFSFYRISKAVHQYFHQALELFSTLNDKTQETISGIRLVKAMGRELPESNAFAEIADRAAKGNYRVARAEALYEPVIFLCMAAALLLTLAYGGWLVWLRELSVGQLTSFTMYLGQLIWPMFAFGWLLNIIERGSAAFTRVQALLDTPDSIVDSGSERPKTANVVVRDLSFTYPDADIPTLRDVGFELARGKVLALVGHTGSGKSTLIQLMLRHWQSEPGRISLDGHALDECSLDAVRACFAYVPQESFLFSMSVAENIALAKPQATAEEIAHAARLASIDEEIEAFPEGYQTLVGERGVTLSGGQRQRVAIARALLVRAPILVLDDALSAVDVHTEQRILEHLENERGGDQSVIVIGHRLSSVRHADEILVLSHGHVTERGNHAALLAHDGWYARMWTYQQMEAALDEF